jgi:hypothetical protein
MTPDAWHRMKPLPFYQVEYFWKDSRCVGWLASGSGIYILGFPFYFKKLFTRNIVTDVTDGYYVVITVVTT